MHPRRCVTFCHMCVYLVLTRVSTHLLSYVLGVLIAELHFGLQGCPNMPYTYYWYRPYCENVKWTLINYEYQRFTSKF